MAHKVFVFFLVFVGCTATIAIGIMGYGYYTTPIHERPFRQDYEFMKTSGNYSHGLGIVGAAMITIGVATYSSRKRIRSLWSMGKLSVWLEFHIFLCLLGPILVIFHTTFKAGGIAAISLWAMTSVWLSGMVGRFLYAQIPRSVEGAELSLSQIQGELDRLSTNLAGSPLGQQLLKHIDERFAALHGPQSLFESFSAFIRLTHIRREVLRYVGEMTVKNALSSEQALGLRKSAKARAVLLQKSLILTQVGKLFHYWHAIHLPFTIIMFITLAAHVVVAVLLGYTWIF